MGLGGGETLTYTGAEVGVVTATAVHCVPFHFQVLPFEVYICPTVGLGGKEYAILIGLTSVAFTPPQGPNPWLPSITRPPASVGSAIWGVPPVSSA